MMIITKVCLKNVTNRAIVQRLNGQHPLGLENVFWSFLTKTKQVMSMVKFSPLWSVFHDFYLVCEKNRCFWSKKKFTFV